MTSPSQRRPQRPPAARTRAARAYRSAPRDSFLQRNRSRFLWGLAGVALVAMIGMAYANATAPVYGCATQWEPAVTPSPAPSATPRLGYVQDDAGNTHVSLGTFIEYALCPPASGRHFSASGEGPIRASLYGPDDQAFPQGWIHNLEHGGLVVLYRCGDGDPGCSDQTQQAFRNFNTSFPNSPVCNLPAGNVGPVVARFDQMAWPFAALLWGQVLPMDEWDPELALAFFAQQGERTNPEQLCARPTPTPGPTPTAGPTGTPAPSGSPAASGSPATTPAPTATPGAS